MTLKSYLRMLLAAVTLMFVTTGCNDDEKKVGPPPSYTFGIAVSDVTETEATVTVTPSNDQATYYYGAVKKADFDAFESDAAYAQNILATLKAAADRKVLSLEEYLQTALSKGSSPKKIADLTAGTDYYAVAIGILTDGRFTSDLVKEAFKTEATPEPDMVFSITMTPGYNGADTGTKMSVNFKVSERPAVSGKYLLGPTSFIEQQIAAGKSYDDILDTGTNVYEFTADELTELNSEQGTVGENWVWGKLTPETSYTVVARVKDADGNPILKTAEKSTAASQGGGDGPEVHLTMKAGDVNGANKTTSITATVQCSTAVSASYWLSPTATVEENLGKGFTYEDMASPNDKGTNVFSADWIKQTQSADGIPLGYSKCNPGESWTMIVKVTDADGNSTVEHASVTTETGQGGSDQTFSVSVTNIGDKGADITVTPSNSDPYFWGWIESSKIEGATDAEIIQAQLPIKVENLSTGAESISREVFEQYAPFTPNTQYTILVFGTSADGTSATTGLTKKEFTTTNGGDVEPSDAYKAWLGTWTVTSTSSEISKAPIEFEVTFNQKVANSSYVAVGWTTALWRDDPSKYNSYFATAKFDAETGNCYFDNAQVIFDLDDEDGTGEYLFNIRYAATDGKTYVNNSNQIKGMVGTLESNKSSAQMVGSQLQNENGENVGVVTSMSHFYWYYTGVSEGKIYGTTPGTAFKVGTSIDYPIGPYTMVKKSSASSITPSVASIPSLEQMHDARVMHVSNLSSVLSVRAVMTTPSKQRVMLDGKKSVIKQIDFERPAGVYEATISNVANIEKPLGLKKHFIKK